MPTRYGRWRRPTAGNAAAPWYVGAALRRVTANLCACAAATAATGLLGACGGDDERRDADAPDGTYEIAVERRSFPSEQRLAKQATLVLAVRNTGDADPPTNGAGSGTGLARLRERLAVLYGGAATLTTRPLAEGGYEAVLVVPLSRGART